MILNICYGLSGNVRNLHYQTHCILIKANGMALQALWQEAEQMGNHHAEKKQVENLLLLHFHIKGRFLMLGVVWERYLYIGIIF